MEVFVVLLVRKVVVVFVLVDVAVELGVVIDVVVVQVVVVDFQLYVAYCPRYAVLRTRDESRRCRRSRRSRSCCESSDGGRQSVRQNKMVSTHTRIVV